MLNPFPDLLTYSLLAPFILRFFVGLIFIDLGILKLRGEKQRWIASFDALYLRPADFFVVIYGVIQIIGGILLLMGLWTQVAALVFVILTGAELAIDWRMREVLKRDLTFYLLIFIISLSLLLTGAGAFAFDIPL